MKAALYIRVRTDEQTEFWTEASGKLAGVLYAIDDWMSRMEKERRSEQTKAGLKRVKISGPKLGRPARSKDKKERECFLVLRGVE